MIYKKIIELLIFPLYDLITGSSINSYLKYLDETINLSLEEIKSVQKEKLKQVLLSAKKNIKKYEKVPSHDDPYEMLKAFPITERSDVISKDGALLKEDYNHQGNYHSSSGSTGETIQVYLSNEEYSFAQATQLHWLSWIGYQYGNRIIQIGLRENRSRIKKVKDILLNTDYLFYFEIDRDKRIKRLKKNSMFDNVYIMSHPSILVEIIDLCQEEDIKLQVNGILCFGELLTDKIKAKAEKYFGCKVLNTYGSSEGLMIAAGYKSSDLNLMMQNVYVEIVDDNGVNVPDGQMGHVIITNLNAFNMPLIRYRIGDFAKKSTAMYEDCHIKVKKLSAVAGRDNDFFLTPEGGRHHLFTLSGDFNFIEHMVKQYQWHQREIDLLQLRYIPSEIGLISDDDQNIHRQLVREKLKSEIMRIEYLAVDKMIRYRSGKIQRVINDVNQ